MPSAVTTTPATLVTGGSSGIGEAVCRRLLAQGRTVINFSRNTPRIQHEKLQHFSVDLTDLKRLRSTTEEAQLRFHIDRLVNNAGDARPALMEDTSTDDLEYLVDLHLRASLVLIQMLVPAMRKARFGRIVNVVSRAILGKPRRTAYSTTKSGLVGMTRTLAMELGGDQITVNLIAPGAIATELFERTNPPESRQTKKLIDSISVKRMGTPEDVAHAIDFFLAPESGYITGQLLYVCGGSSLGAGAF